MKVYPNNCEHCGQEIASEEDNNNGAFEDYCCKRCDDAAASIN